MHISEAFPELHGGIAENDAKGIAVRLVGT